MTLSSRGRKLVAGALVGGAVGLCAAVAAWTRPLLLERGEWWTYDARARAGAHKGEASPDIVIVDIAEQDIEDVENNSGITWPWPRAMFGYLVEYCTKAGAKVVALDWVFQDRGMYGVNDLQDLADRLTESGRATFGIFTRRAPTPPRQSSGSWAVKLATFDTSADAARAAYALLAWNIRSFLVPAAGAAAGAAAAQRVELYAGGTATSAELDKILERIAGEEALASLFAPPDPAGEPAAPPEEPKPPERLELSPEAMATEVTAASIIHQRDGLPLSPPAGMAIPRRDGIDAPVGMLAAAAPVANVVQSNEADGLLRRHQPFIEHQGRLYPSLPLRAWLLGHPDVKPRFEGDTLILGDRRVPLDDEGAFSIRFHGGSDAYEHIPAYEIFRSIALQDEDPPKPPIVPPEALQGKYVIISASATALRDIRVSPVSRLHLGAAINAAALDNLLQGRFIERTPPWFDALIALALAVLLAVSMVFVWSAIPSTLGAYLATTAATALVLGGYVLVAFRLYDGGTWLPVAAPATGAAVATFASLLVASALERRDRRFVQEALGRYTSDELVKELIEHPEHLSLEWGEQREMSVYFSDIAGFTTISEGLDAKRLVALLNDYLTSMTDIILAHGGVVDKYIGDAIMAFWGAPLPAKDHAIRAVRCAIAMRARCLELAPKWKAEYGQTVMARAGVNSGQAVVGNMGSKHKYNYTVMGDMVNLASRLEGANKPYGTLLMISEFTHARVASAIFTRELDKMTVKGKEQPVTVHEVIAEKGQVDPALEKIVDRFHDGLALYRERRFTDAIAVFQENGDDGPSRLYIERSKHFLSEPPPADWDGVWHMKEK